LTEGTAPPVAAPPEITDDGRLDGASRPRLIAVLIIIVLLSEIIPFTYSLAIVITPLVGKSFPAAGNSITWMITIIGVVGGATIALVTKMADLWGKKRVMLASAVIFWVGTLFCAFTSSWALFLVGRALEGIAIGMSALCYSLVRDIMPRSWVPITIGFIGTGIGVSGIAAPLIGGLLTDHYSWRAIFWFMVIYMAVAIPLFAWFVPESKVRVRQRLDVLGAILIGVGLAGVLIYLSEGQSWGWGNIGCLAYLIGGLVALAAFFAWEMRISYPLIDLRLLRSPQLSTLLGLSFFTTAAFTGLTVLPSFMFLFSKAQVEGAVYAAAEAQSHLPLATLSKFISFRGDISYAAGFDLFALAWHILLWGAIGAMIAGPVGAILARRVGARKPLIAGTVILIVATAVLVAWHSSWVPEAIFFTVGSVGSGLAYGTAPNMLVDVVPPEQQAISAGLYAGIGSIGSSFMTAAMTAILIGFPFQIVALEPSGSGFKTDVTNISQVYTASGYGYAYILAVGASVIALVLAVIIRAGRAPARGGATEGTAQ
jgi:MFS family permease